MRPQDFQEGSRSAVSSGLKDVYLSVFPGNMKLVSPGLRGRCAGAGQEAVRSLHREASRPDRRLSGTRDLRWVLRLERLPNAHR